MIPSEFPLEGSGDAPVFALKGEDALAEFGERQDVVWGEHLSLQDREEDLDLIQPAGVKRKVDESEVAIRCLQPLDRPRAAVGRAVVDDPEDSLGRTIWLAPHDLVDQPSEGCDTGLLFQAAEELGAVNVPGSEVRERATPVVLVLDQRGMAGSRWPRWVATWTRSAPAWTDEQRSPCSGGPERP